MDLAIKAIFGAITVLIVQLFAQSKSFYIAGLAPLFPAFALISYYIVGTQRNTSDLRETILFSIFSLVPYLLYLISLYFLVGKYKLVTSLMGATIVWFIFAGILIMIWDKIGNI